MRVTDSSTYSVIGATSKVPIAVVAELFFMELVKGEALAVVVGAAGVMLYAWAKRREKKEGSEAERKEKEENQVERGEVLPRRGRRGMGKVVE